MTTKPIPRELLTDENLSAVTVSILYRTPIQEYRQDALVLRDAILDRRPWFRKMPDPPAPTRRVLCYMVAHSAKVSKTIQGHIPMANAIHIWCQTPNEKNTRRLWALNWCQPTAMRDLLDMTTTNHLSGYGAFDLMHKFLSEYCGMSQTTADHHVNRYRVLTALSRWVPPYSEIVEANKSG